MKIFLNVKTKLVEQTWSQTIQGKYLAPCRYKLIAIFYAICMCLYVGFHIRTIGYQDNTTIVRGIYYRSFGLAVGIPTGISYCTIRDSIFQIVISSLLFVGFHRFCHCGIFKQEQDCM